MKLTNQLRGRRIRKHEWPADEWIKVAYAGKDFNVCVDMQGHEILFPSNPSEDDWELFYPHIKLKPLKADFDEDNEEQIN